MPRRSSSCQPVTVYRLDGGKELTGYLVSTMDGVVHHEPVMVGEVEGHLVVGTRRTAGPVWAEQLRSLTGYRADLPGQQPYAVLLVPLGEWTFALTFGSGHHLIEDEFVDRGFGLSFGIRRLNAERLSSIASAALDVSARSTLTSFPSGGALGAFRLEPFGELVTRVAGAANLDGLTYGRETGRRHQVRAADSLHVPLPSEAGALLADLVTLTGIVDEADEHSALRFMAQTRRLEKNHPAVPELEARLAVALGGDATAGALGLAWPSTALDEIDAAGSFKVGRLGSDGPFVFTPDDDLGVFTGRFAEIAEARRITVLRTAHVGICADEAGTATVRTPISLRKWFAFETVINRVTYCYHQGDWYRIGEGFVDQIRGQVAELLSHRADLEFPTWVPSGQPDDENRYCQRVAERPGYLCLDRSFASTPFHRTFELCDLVGPDDQLVHVKWLGRATAASHLYVQASTAAWSLRNEPEALRQLQEKVQDAEPGRTLTGPSAIVLAIAGRAWDVDKLFTMSQIGLLHLDREARYLRTNLQFAEIPFVRKKNAKRARKAA
jgi:uncharacterized protein (TIGR04141 family)